MKIYSFANRPKLTPESGGRVSRVETAGYVPADRRIRDLMSAGQRLFDYRKMRYDIPSDKDGPDVDLDVDITRRPGFDLAEATQAMHEVTARLKRDHKGDKPVKGSVKDPDLGNESVKEPVVPAPDKGA